MCRNPDAKDSDVGCCDDDYSAPFDAPYVFAVLSDEGNTIDNDLHKQLDFKDPAEEDEEENGDPVLG